MAQIIITIGLDGNPTIEVNGAAGKACELMTAPFEEAFGKVTSRELKPEYEMRPRATETERRRVNQ